MIIQIVLCQTWAIVQSGVKTSRPAAACKTIGQIETVHARDQGDKVSKTDITSQRQQRAQHGKSLSEIARASKKAKLASIVRTKTPWRRHIETRTGLERVEGCVALDSSPSTRWLGHLSALPGRCLSRE